MTYGQLFLWQPLLPVAEVLCSFLLLSVLLR